MAMSLRTVYRDLADLHAQGRKTVRTVRPLGCFDRDATWTLSAWCETRESFRASRPDRLASQEALPDAFRDEPGKTLVELLRRVGLHPQA
jgi:predicted DNA-binding transcriptional regulator YafY